LAAAATFATKRAAGVSAGLSGGGGGVVNFFLRLF